MRRTLIIMGFILLGIISACTPRRPAPVAPIVQDTASPLIQSALKLHAAGDYMGAADYFLRAAEASPTTDLRRRCLAAAALSYLKAGKREKFLEVEVRLEGELSELEKRLPPQELADVIALARLMRGEEPPRNVSPSVQNLIDDLRFNRRRVS